MAETAGPAIAGGKVLDHVEYNRDDRHHDELGNPVARLYPERFAAAIPA